MIARQIYLFRAMKTPMDTSGKVFVHGYRRNNGTQVKSYWRKLPVRGIGARRHTNQKNGQIPLLIISCDGMNLGLREYFIFL